MATNRFYEGSQTPYLSQFVPEKLPIDLMVQTLNHKQAAEDLAVANTNKLGLWDIPALPGEDAATRDKYKKSIERFIDESFGIEQSSPEFQRKYIAKVRDIRDNPELKSITTSYNTHEAYLKRIQELKQSPNTYAAAQELAHEYNQKYGIYTKSPELGGRGFRDTNNSLGDPNILTGNDINKEGKEYFDMLKADGFEKLGFLEEGLAYKNGWEGISGRKIEGQAANRLDSWISSPSGQQLLKRYDARMFPNDIPARAIEKMTPEQKDKYNKDRLTYAANELLSIGKGFAFDKTTTNADVAYRDRWGVGQERANLYPTPQIMNVAGDTAPFVRNYDKDVQEQTAIKDKVTNLSWGIDNYEKAKANPNLNPQFSKLAQVSPQTVETWKAQRYALEQEQKHFQTREANATKKSYVVVDPKIDPKYVDEYGDFKLKYTPFNSGSIPMQEITALNDKFSRDFDNLKTLFKAEGLSGAAPIAGNIAQFYKTSYSLNQTFAAGLEKINTVRKALGNTMSDDDRQALDFFEQKYRIQHANIMSNIPEQYLDVSENNLGAIPYNQQIEVEKTLAGRESFIAAKKANYSDVGSWTPNAQLRDPDVVTLVDQAGQAGKPVESADAMAERFVGLYPQQNIVMLGNEVIEPGDPRYPLANGKAKVVSSTVDKINNDDTPVLQVNYQYNTKVQKPVYDDEGKVKYSKEEDAPANQTYTVIMKGANALQYNQMKANQLKSDIIKNPNDMQNAVRLINMNKFNDPKLSSDLTELSKLKAGDTYTTEIGSSRDNTNLSVDIKRSSIDDSWDVIVKDPDTGESKKTNLPTAKDAANYYMNIYK